MTPRKKTVQSVDHAEISQEEIVAIGAFLLLSQHESGHGGTISWAQRKEEKRRIAIGQRDPRKAMRKAFPSREGSQ